MENTKELRIDPSNIHKLRMTAINTYDEFKKNGTRNTWAGELYAWFTFDDKISFTVQNLNASYFFDLHYMELAYNPNTNYWDEIAFITKVKYRRHKENGKPLVEIENIKKRYENNEISTAEANMLIEELGEIKLEKIPNHPLVTENALEEYSVEEFNTKLKELY